MLALVSLCLFASPPTGVIAFVAGSEQEEHCVIVASVDGAHSQRVGPGHRDGAPKWSPNGEWLAFESATGEGLGVYIVRYDGTQGRFIEHAHSWNRDPVWSLAGEQIAYSAGDGLEQELVVYDLASGRESIWGGGAKGLFVPEWLHPGYVAILRATLEDLLGTARAPALDGGDAETSGLIAMGVTGEGDDRSLDMFIVTPGEVYPFPSWAMPSKGRYEEWNPRPAPQKVGIVFESNDGGDREIFVLTTKGSNDLSNHRSADWNPRWSPDGKWIAFESFRTGRRAIHRVHKETIRVFEVAVSAGAENWAPYWSPNGEWIAHVSNRSGAPRIYLTNVESGESLALAVDAADAFAPAWQPAG